MKRLFLFGLVFSLGVCALRVGAYEPCQRRVPLALTAPQSNAQQIRVDPAQLACEKRQAPAWRVTFLESQGATASMAWAPVSTAGWREDEGLVFLFRPDGSNRYVDLVLEDPASHERFSYGITLRDPACREAFVPFKLLTQGKKPFSPREHARVSVGWGLGSPTKPDLVFTTGDYFVGRLNPAEAAWPASTPPFVGTSVYLETFESAPRYKALDGATVKLVAGPPPTAIARALEVQLAAPNSQVQWDFADTGRWRYFDGMTVWSKGERAGARFLMELLATRLDGKGTVLFRHDFLAGGAGWDVEHIEWDDFLDDAGHNIEPEDFGRIVLSVRPVSGQALPTRVWIGPFRLDDE